MKALVLSGLFILSFQAAGDGFICRAPKENLNIALYNSTKAPRLAEVMIVSDPTIAYGKQTIARFSREDGTLATKGDSYVGTVDPNAAGTSRVGENIAGTKLGAIKDMALTVDFSYVRPVADGEELEGLLIISKRNGDEIDVELECLRYLPGE